MRQFKIQSDKLTDRDRNIERYFVDVNNMPDLTPEEEMEYAVKAREGCEASRLKLVECNLKFVISVAKMYQRGNPVTTLGDLVNEGNVGLIAASHKFDPTMGFKFISYAVWYIRARIQEFLSRDARTIKIPGRKIWALIYHTA